MLPDEDRAVLELAAEDIRSRGAMEREIRRRFGWSSTRYYQRLDRLVWTRAALEHDPMTCRRVLAIAEGVTP